MAQPLVGTIATDREVSDVRQSSQSFDHSTVFRPSHLSFVPLYKFLPSSAIVVSSRRRNERGTRCQVRKPNVEPIVDGVTILRDTAWWSPNCSKSNAFTAFPGCAKLNDFD